MSHFRSYPTQCHERPEFYSLFGERCPPGIFRYRGGILFAWYHVRPTFFISDVLWSNSEPCIMCKRSILGSRTIGFADSQIPWFRGLWEISETSFETRILCEIEVFLLSVIPNKYVHTSCANCSDIQWINQNHVRLQDIESWNPERTSRLVWCLPVRCIWVMPMCKLNSHVLQATM